MAVGRLTQASKVRKPEKYVNFAATMAPASPRGSRPQGGLAWYHQGSGDGREGNYYTLDAEGQDDELLGGNTGWARQNEGVPIFPYAQSLMRRCVLQNDGEAVAYYLDCDNSAKKAGKWLRVHEGSFDPISGVPNIDPLDRNGSPTLREGVPAWDDETEYEPGERVLHDDLLWECLEGNSNVEPESGTEDAVLDGTDGQVMVEIPRFYLWYEFDETLFRHAWELYCDPEEVKPFPDLTLKNSHLPTRRLVEGRVFEVHKAFQKADIERTHRYVGAARATATNTGNNSTGTLLSTFGADTASVSANNFRTKARNMNVGLYDPSGDPNNVWQLFDYWQWHAIMCLYLTEYRTFFGQGVLGRGSTSTRGVGALPAQAGRVAVGNASGTYNPDSGALTTVNQTASYGPAYRGIAHIYGVRWVILDGFLAAGLRYFVSNTPADFSGAPTEAYGELKGSLSGLGESGSSGYASRIDGSFMKWPNGTGSWNSWACGYFGYPNNIRTTVLAQGSETSGERAEVNCLETTRESTDGNLYYGCVLAR